MNTRKKVLVVYYSLTGNTARVAQDLAARLDADIESVRDPTHGTGTVALVKAAFDAWRRKPAKIGTLQCNPSDYVVTIVGTPVWAMHITPAVRTYLKLMSTKFGRVAFFVTSGNTEVSKLVSDLEGVARCKAVATAGFSERELSDASVYERKLLTFIQDIERGCAVPRLESEFAASF